MEMKKNDHKWRFLNYLIAKFYVILNHICVLMNFFTSEIGSDIKIDICIFPNSNWEEHVKFAFLHHYDTYLNYFSTKKISNKRSLQYYYCSF